MHDRAHTHAPCSDGLVKKKWTTSLRELSLPCQTDVFRKLVKEGGLVRLVEGEHYPPGCPRSVNCYRLPNTVDGDQDWRAWDRIFHVDGDKEFPWHRAQVQPSKDFVIVGEFRVYHCEQIAPVRVPLTLDADGDLTYMTMFRRVPPNLWVVFTACKVSGAACAMLQQNHYRWIRHGY